MRQRRTGTFAGFKSQQLPVSTSAISKPAASSRFQYEHQGIQTSIRYCNKSLRYRSTHTEVPRRQNRTKRGSANRPSHPASFLLISFLYSMYSTSWPAYPSWNPYHDVERKEGAKLWKSTGLQAGLPVSWRTVRKENPTQQAVHSCAARLAASCCALRTAVYEVQLQQLKNYHRAHVCVRCPSRLSLKYSPLPGVGLCSGEHAPSPRHHVLPQQVRFGKARM